MGEEVLEKKVCRREEYRDRGGKAGVAISQLLQNTFETRRNRVKGGNYTINPPLPPFLCVSKVLGLMKAFVTGATGFVGSHVARALAEQGADLRLLVRPSSRTDNIADLRAEVAIGDLCEPESLRTAMQGCDVVFHVAADYRIWVRDPEHMYRANVEGTRAVIEAAQACGVRRVVYCSSVATMGFTQSGQIVDEDTPVSLADMVGHYKRSKFMAEQIALEAGRKGANVVVVNPTTPIGERDIKPTPTGRIIVDFLNRKFPAYVDTGLNLADVTEVARGYHRAAFAYHESPPCSCYGLCCF
jgi:dihydroflavonol-4-reductase